MANPGKSEPGEATLEQDEAAMDAALAEIVGDDPEEDLTEVDDVEEGGEESTEDSPEEGSNTDPEEPDPGALHAAKAALYRDGWRDKAISALSDEEVLDLGAKRAEHQANIDAIVQERDRLRSTTTQERGATEGATAEPTPDPSEAASARVEPLVDALGLDGDDAAAARDALTGLVSDATKPLQEQLKTLQDALQVSQAQAGQAQLTALRNELAERLPQLHEDGTWEQAVKAGDALHDQGFHADISDPKDRAKKLILAGARAIFGSEIPSDREIERRNKISAAKRTGQPSTRASKTVERELTEDQKILKSLQIIEKGGGARDIAEKVGAFHKPSKPRSRR